MNWNDFLEKIATYKRDYQSKQLSLSYASLVALLFAGAFDKALGRTPTAKEYISLAEDLKRVMGTTANLPKVKKGDSYGIVDVKDELSLNLWRNEVNPLQTFEFIKLFKDKIIKLGFKNRISNDAPYAINTGGQSYTYLFNNWEAGFNDIWRHKVVGRYAKDCAAFVGVIKESAVKKTSNGKEYMTIRMQIDSGMTGPIKIWGNKDGIIGYRFTTELLPGKIGMMTVKLDDSWNNVKQGNFIEWDQFK